MLRHQFLPPNRIDEVSIQLDIIKTSQFANLFLILHRPSCDINFSHPYRFPVNFCESVAGPLVDTASV